jgi:alpha-L-fucosidase 2
MRIRTSFRAALGALLLVASRASGQSAPKPLSLWYDAPATQWVEALPIGNGRLGAMEFGGAVHDRIQFNEASVWTGGPHDYARPGASRYLSSIRSLLYAHRQKEAEELAQVHFMSAPVRQRAYQAFGDLRLNFQLDSATVSDYRRELDLDSAIATTRFSAGGVGFTRQLFASHPDQVIVVRLCADQPGRLSFVVTPTSAHKWSLRRRAGEDALSMQGMVEDGVIEFEARLLVQAEGGRVSFSDWAGSVSGATSATLVLAGATNFVS